MKPAYLKGDCMKYIYKYKILYLALVCLFAIISTKTVTLADNFKYKIVVNKGTNCVSIYRLENLSYVPYKAMICSVGANNGTPAGSYNLKERYLWRPLFGDVFGQYATRIDGDILFHSVYYKATSPDTLQTEEYNKLGTSASMGCVRLAAIDAKWIYDNCPPGTSVTIIENGTDPLPRPEAIVLGPRALYPHWDPTDPNPNNPWRNEGIKFDFTSLDKKVEASDKLTSEKLEGVICCGIYAYDTADNLIPYTIEHNIDPNKKGTYEVYYVAKDALGKSGKIKGYLTIE